MKKFSLLSCRLFEGDTDIASQSGFLKASTSFARHAGCCTQCWLEARDAGRELHPRHVDERCAAGRQFEHRTLEGRNHAGIVPGTPRDRRMDCVGRFANEPAGERCTRAVLLTHKAISILTV